MMVNQWVRRPASGTTVSKHHKVKLFCQTWTIRWVNRLKDAWGDCNWDSRTIRIARDAKGIQELDTLIHEMGHAMMPYMTEEMITRFGTDMATVLWELGYRRVENDDQ